MVTDDDEEKKISDDGVNYVSVDDKKDESDGKDQSLSCGETYVFFDGSDGEKDMSASVEKDFSVVDLD
ncbi:hypothetical protein A2U01_0089424, partial [Trifolium medium]|nr:hypothetical protein [Trifolium medium]